MKDYNGTEVNIGDTIKVREYNDMAYEFGIDADGNISPELVKHRFMFKFKKYCGKKFTVTEIFKWSDCEFARSVTCKTDHGYLCNLPSISIIKIK